MAGKQQTADSKQPAVGKVTTWLCSAACESCSLLLTVCCLLFAVCWSLFDLDRGQLDTLWTAPYTPPLARATSSCKLVLSIRLEKISAEGIIGELDAKS
jgi:hypothetical protein